MRKNKLFISIISLIGSLLTFSIVNGVSVSIPKSALINPDYPNATTQIEWSYSFLKIISFVNSYLWFAIGFVCFLFMVVNGFKLITARGDSKQTKAATSALIWSIVGLVVCLLSYIIVNLAVRLFA